uniref:Sodium channel protein Nach n=1 Tax=Glossina morsitans morsitans TaxID=37546 RepID=A0A1B0ETT1_GLOMM
MFATVQSTERNDQTNWEKLKEKFKFLNGIINYIILYIENCSIHGLHFLTKGGLTLFERLFWLILVILSQYFCVYIAMSSVYIYQTKNTHVGIERDFYFWNTSLPSVTICPMKRIDDEKFDEFCDHNDIVLDRKKTLRDFLEQLANSTYINFKYLPDYGSIYRTLDKLNVKPQQYMELIYNVTADMTRNPIDMYRARCIHDNANIQVRQVLTEYGLCYLTNNYLGQKYTSSFLIYGQYPDVNPFEGKKPFRKILSGSFFDKDVSYTFIGFPESIDLFVHSPYDVMKVDSNFGYAEDHLEFDPATMEIVTGTGFDEASVRQRHCRFPHESNLTHFPIYTKNICLQECRLNLVYKTCKCIPHFYPNRFGKPKAVCDYRTLKECVGQYADQFLKLFVVNSAKGVEIMTNKNLKRAPCYCDQNCEDSVVTIQAVHHYIFVSVQVMLSSKPLLGSIGAQVSMKTWPRQRLKRIIIFNFSDLLVYIGGTAGLFMGFSVLGALEIVYFFTLRLLFHLLGYKL